MIARSHNPPNGPRLADIRLLAAATALLCLAACHRAPQNARDLLEQLPRHWEGEVRLPDEGLKQKLAIEVRELTVRDAHLLEFNRIRYQSSVGGQAVADEEAVIRGTINVPGGEIRLEEEGTEAGEAVKASTFTGKLSADLRSVTASWNTGSGQAGTLQLRAVAQ